MGFSNLWAKRLFTTSESKFFGVIDTIWLICQRLGIFFMLFTILLSLILVLLGKESFTSTVDRIRRRRRRRR